MIDLEDIETVGVIRAGTMGSGIAQVSAQAGYQVVLRDVEESISIGASRRSTTVWPGSSRTKQ
jgi:3-hydroxyacyl-CoA dehydrogenase